jgi:hypothetical protein
METRDRILLAAGILAAAGAAALALGRGRGNLDADPPPPPPPPQGTQGTGGGFPAGPRRLPPPRIPDALPAAAAEGIRAAWAVAEGGSPAEAAAALAALPGAARIGTLKGCAAEALTALAPSLEVLIVGGEDPIPEAAMGAAAGLARAGGEAGRKALAASGLVPRAFGLRVSTAPPALQAATARHLGVAGGKEAVEWLVLLLGDRERADAVRAAAAEGIGDAALAGGPFDPAALLAAREAADPGAPVEVRRAALRAFAAAWERFRPYDVAPPVAAALRDADPALRLEAALFLPAHPLTGAGEALVAALSDPDPRILEPVADAVAAIRPPGAREALERIAAGPLSDRAARASVERALRSLGRPPR